MKKLIIFLFLLASIQSYSQETTTFILLRHAEKATDGTDDPALTKEGEARANHLVEMFSKADITAIYSTDFKRTRMTVAPLANSKELEIQTYKWENPKALINKILEANTGGTIVICGHSNTTPILASLLTGKALFAAFEDDDYSNLLIITATKVGAGKLLHMGY
jgi:broad specificity phosphatase PhoE